MLNLFYLKTYCIFILYQCVSFIHSVYFPKGAVITNVARGDIVDDEALIDALDKRKIYAVGLDVYKGEPNLNPGYLKFKQAFILPHLGSATKDTRLAMANLAIDNIDEFFKTGKCINIVNEIK